MKSKKVMSMILVAAMAAAALAPAIRLTALLIRKRTLQKAQKPSAY